MRILRTPHSKLARRVLFIVAFAAVSAILLIRQRTLSVRAAEQHATEFVLIDGYVSGGYASTPLSAITASILGGKGIGTIPQTTAAFSIDRMTDNMALSLVDIRDLHAIFLYPPGPDWSDVDVAAATFTEYESLRDLDLPLSEKGLAMLEDRFPDLVVYVVSRSPSTGPEE